LKENQRKEYMLVMEYVDNGPLRKYLKENFENLTWYDKFNLAFQLVCAVSFLHNEGVVHCDLVNILQFIICFILTIILS
jgi:serine/threonine protein kinase